METIRNLLNVFFPAASVEEAIAGINKAMRQLEGVERRQARKAKEAGDALVLAQDEQARAERVLAKLRMITE